MKITPLYPGTKQPMLNSWTHWNHGAARQAFVLEGLVNFGLLLGDIMDVEGDSEEANNKILDLIGDYPHPCYSSRKSIHHLFISPNPKLTIFKRNHIEFRGASHQSVIPPSTLISGVKYEWIQDLNTPIPVMPKNLLRFFWSMVGRDSKMKPGHTKMTCYSCRGSILMSKKRLALEKDAVQKINTQWMCNNCRPYDLRDLCRSLRK